MSYKNLMEERGGKLYFPDFKTKKSSRRWYPHDIDVIIYSEMFRKMQRKAQLLSIQDPVSRSRLIHTFEVVRIAKEISEKLELNTELTEAIALAHDFGNVAYGKIAEKFLQRKTNCIFKHEQASALMLKVCSVRPIPDKYRNVAKNAIESEPETTHFIEIAEFPYVLEVFKYKNSIYYICISPEVIDGVIKHGTDNTAFTIEGQVVNYADNIAYLIQDISDFESTGIFDRETKERYERSLAHLEEIDSNKQYPISGVVGKTTSLRTATLIERFVAHNKELLEKGKFNNIYSEILSSNIPLLEIEPIVKDAIDSCWNFKNEFYEHDLIKISNVTALAKMEQIWDILKKDSAFIENNKSYIDFENMLKSPIFTAFKRGQKITDDLEWEKFKKAFFISHLTCDEINLIISSFLERDYTFDLSLPRIIKS